MDNLLKKPFQIPPLYIETMLEFTKLDEKVSVIEKYLPLSEISFCDISVGEKYMWRNYFTIEYTVVNDTLIMKESSPEYSDVFYYPMGKDIEGAIEKIEEYCKAKNIPLTFCCIDERVKEQLVSRYPLTEYRHDRDWDDYIYDAEKFKTYSGKKFSGQRNHVNKFKKLYPNYQVIKVTETEKEDAKAFIRYLSDKKEESELEKAEHELIFDYIDNMEKLNQVGALIKVDGKTVALSFGEVLGDTLIVHIEKADTDYNGAYPMMASEFAKAFAGEGVNYINREEDCGDEGLRTSKMQYQPIDIKRKYEVKVKTLFRALTPPIEIKSARLTVGDILPADAEDYYRLYMDDDLNKWWGYDYREDLGGETPSPEYFYRFQQKLKDQKEEYSFAVKENGKMVGELVLHNFTFYGGVEMGYRFFRECHGKGYATESALALKKFVIETLKPKTLMTRCYKENIPSKNLIGRIGFKDWYQTETHYFFKIDF